MRSRLSLSWIYSLLAKVDFRVSVYYLLGSVDFSIVDFSIVSCDVLF